MLGADLMAQAVERQGVRTVFGLPGHLESFFGAVDRRGMRLLHMRHESAVVLAADGYATTRRTLGVACVTSGPGLANAVGGIASANDAGTPLIIFAGRNPFAMLDARPQQELDHARLVRSVTKWSQVVHDANRLGEYVEMAARIALSGDPGPVLLEIPRDVATATVDEAAAAGSLGPVIRAHAPRPAPDDVARASALLAKAKRPLIVAGRGAYWSHAGAVLQQLNREYGIPVLLQGPSRGLIPEDFETVFGWPMGSICAREADVVIFAGGRLEGGIGFAAPPFFAADAAFIQVANIAEEIGRNRVVEAPMAGDTRLALEALRDGLAAAKAAAWDGSWAKAAIAPRVAKIESLGHSEDGQVHPLRMARELAARMAPDALFVGDVPDSIVAGVSGSRTVWRDGDGVTVCDRCGGGVSGRRLYASGLSWYGRWCIRAVSCRAGDGLVARTTDLRDGGQRRDLGFEPQHHAAVVQRYDGRGHESEPV
jgi:acetolactate synthase-1/2/3 large subunit